jgi:hypothetical protein
MDEIGIKIFVAEYKLAALAALFFMGDALGRLLLHANQLYEVI